MFSNRGVVPVGWSSPPLLLRTKFIRVEMHGGEGGVRKHQIRHTDPTMFSCPFSGLQRTNNFISVLHWSVHYTTA